ncbi:MAG: hypothetical protein KatS3mg076_0452 [Candidatus Binatia bacterium]|nr:MAG: hypothetical protein KatS3mg076_0452 [Candidatus Binatia bacterium]
MSSKPVVAVLRDPESRAAPRTVAFVEASSGGIVGGSLTGILQQIDGMGENWKSVLVLYEPKGIEPKLEAAGVRVRHVRRRRLPKEHPLQAWQVYHRARRAPEIRRLFRAARTSLRTAFEEFPAAVRLARIFREEKPDVVHLANGVRANFDGILASWLCGLPCVCHVKGFEKYGSRERWAARKLDAMVCMTEAIRLHCESAGVVAPRTRVIYDALDFGRFRPGRSREEVRSEWGLGPDALVCGIVGGIQEWKGQAVLVEAFARAIASGREDLWCVVVGGVHRAGEEYARKLVGRVRELGLERRVLFLGFRQDVPDVMQALDIVVHASVRPEPFGRVLLEAMALGKPVIATSAGGVVEFVRDGWTGLLVPPGDVEALAAALLRLAVEPELRSRLGHAAREEVRDRFRIENHVARMTELYEQILRGERRP